MKTILRLVVFIRSRWGWLALAFACLVASTAFGMILPRMLGDGVDTALRVGESGFLWWPMARETAIWLVAGTIIVASTLRGVSDYGQQYLSEVVSQKVSYDIRNAIYDRLQRLSFSYYDQAQTGQLMSRATVDVEAIRMFFGMGLIGIVQAVIMVVAISIILLLMDWRLALMTMAFLPFICWIAYKFSSHIRPMWLRIQEQLAVLGTRLQESLTGIRIVKSFSREKEEGQKFAAHDVRNGLTHGPYPLVWRTRGNSRYNDHRLPAPVHTVCANDGDARPPHGNDGKPYFPYRISRAAYSRNT